MKILTSILFSLLFFSQLLAQDIDTTSIELLSPDEMVNQPNFFLENIDDANQPNDKGEVKLFLLQKENGAYQKEEHWQSPKLIYQLYVTGLDRDKSRFPSEVFNFPKLQTLVFPLWKLTEIPATLPISLPNLQYLDVQGSPITTLPETLKEMKYLTNINLIGTNVSDKELKRLKELMPHVTFFK